MTEDEREELIQHLLEQFIESVGPISDDARYAFIAGVRAARADNERLRAVVIKATKTWRRESSPNSIKIYKAMEALERALERKP